MGTAARASILAAFTSGQGYSADADYSPRAWLINRTRITKGAAVGVHRVGPAGPPRIREVAAALAAGEMSESFARTICHGRTSCRRTAGRTRMRSCWRRRGTGMDLRDLAGLAGEIYARSLPEDPDDGKDEAFEDRSVRLETTFDGAGVLHGDLTPECASVVAAVLDALSAPAGAEDTRSQAQRYHDALQRGDAAAGHRRAAARAGRAAGQGLGAHLAGGPDGAGRQLGAAGGVDRRVRAQWAGHRAAASAGGSDGGAWLDGDAAEAVACDAAMAPFVTGEVNPAALDDLVRLCVQLDRLRHHGTGTGEHRRRRRRRRARPRTPPGPGRPSSRPSSARRSTSCPAPAGWRRSCAAGSSAPGWAARACRWTSATPRPSRPRSATRSSCATSTASGPAAATSPRRPARSTTSGTRRTAARPASEIVFYLCWFHHQVVIHRWGWTLVLNPDGTTTAWNPDKTKVLHSHSPPARPGGTPRPSLV